MVAIMTSKTVMVMAGGTGGHVFPALAVADELNQQGYQIHWLGTAAGIESEIIPKAGYPLHCIEVKGLRGTSKITLLAAPFKILKAITQALRFMRIVKPDAVLGLGGFATGPGGVAAKILGIPLLIHEQNAVPGMTNRLLKPMSNVVMQAFPNTFKNGKESDTFLTTGNPVRANIVALNTAHFIANKDTDNKSTNTKDINAKNDTNNVEVKSKEKLKILAVGGSLGAVGINNAIVDALALIEEKENEYCSPNIWHQVGKKNIDEVQKAYEKNGLTGKANVVAFIDDIAEAYKWADIVLCRSGALTVSELACAGKAAIFVPYPFAADDHQTANAHILVNTGAAELIQQNELTGEWLVKRWQHYSENSQQLKKMSIAASNASIANATQVVAEQVIKQIRLND